MCTPNLLFTIKIKTVCQKMDSSQEQTQKKKHG